MHNPLIHIITRGMMHGYTLSAASQRDTSHFERFGALERPLVIIELRKEAVQVHVLSAQPVLQ